MNLLKLIIKRIHKYFKAREILKSERQIDMKRRELFNKDKKSSLLEQTNSNKKIKFHLNLENQNEILKINIVSKKFNKFEIEEILNAFKNDIELKKLVSGKKINLKNIDFEDLQRQLNNYNQNLKNINSTNFDVHPSQMLLNAQYDNSSKEVKNFVKKFNEYKPIPKIDSKKYNWLRDYQKKGYLWMKKLLNFNIGCLLADDMGLGKTIQVISIIMDILSENPKARILIVCPSSLIYNWKKEINHHFDKCDSIAMVFGTKSKREKLIISNQHSIYITPTSSVWRDFAFYDNLNLELLILDEAQSIKNETTNTAKGLTKIKAKKRIALTGTPIENHLGELWSILNFLNPGILGKKEDFFDKYEKPILSGDEIKSQILKKILKNFILRRTKEEVLHELPPKITNIYTIKFSQEEENLYNSIILNLKNKISSETMANKKYGFFFKALTLLRQTCCDPRLIKNNNIHASSSKLVFLLDKVETIIKENSKNKILIFSQFTSMLDLIKKELEKKAIKHYLLTGKDEIKTRLEKVENFNNGAANVFLISLKAGGTGLNITSANYVFHYDPWWNLAAENQATDRAHRMGQKNVIFVNKLIIKNTLEEKIIKIQNRKFELFETFIESKGKNIKMDLNSLKEIIGI